MIYNAQLQKTINSINSTTHAAAAPSNLDAAIVYNAILRYWTAKHNRIIATAWEIAPPKPDLGAKAEKKILKHFWKGIFKGKSQAPKLRKSADKSLSQPWCSHSITIYDVQLQKTIVFRMQRGQIQENHTGIRWIWAPREDHRMVSQRGWHQQKVLASRKRILPPDSPRPDFAADTCETGTALA